MAEIDDFLDYAYSKNFSKANNMFGELIGNKITNALDQEKIKVAGQIYNEMEEEDFEIDDEEQLTVSDEEEETEEEMEDYSEEDELVDDSELVTSDI